MRSTERSCSRRSARLAVLSFVGLGVVSCSVVADLGPEAHPQVETCRPPGGSPQSDRCSACVNAHCCPQATRCGDDPACSDLLECFVDCAFQFECTSECTKRGNGNQAFEDVTNCSVQFCIQNSECLPGPNCNELGGCCIRVKDPTARHACAVVAQSLDEQLCTNNLPRFCPLGRDAGPP